ncbi:MAG: hypothetical protein ACT4TC_18275 [Myxococcaceae bacterium]
MPAVVRVEQSPEQTLPVDGAVERVRSDHLAYLIEKIPLATSERHGWISKAYSAAGASRVECLEFLDSHRPGTRNRLRALWTAYGRHSLFLFRTSALQKLSEKQTTSLVSLSLKRSGVKSANLRADGAWHVVPVMEPALKERVHKIRLEPTRLISVVRMTRTQSFVHEEEERTFSYTYDVQVVVQLDTHVKLTEVYGAQTDGKRSMRALLAWLTGEEVPVRKPKQTAYFAPVEFNESDVKRLATKNALELVGMEGPDSKGVIGKVGYRGKHKGLVLQALDLGDTRIKAQDAHPQDVRTYRFAYAHTDDGFVEQGQAEFTFGKRHQRLAFPARATKPAMEHVIQLLYRHVSSGD